MIAERYKSLTCVIFILMLLGCAESDPEKQEPTSNSETVIVGETVVLTANNPTSANSEINQTDLVFLWEFLSKPDGSVAQLDNSNSSNASFIADFEGIYLLKSTVTHQNQLLSETEFEVVAQPQNPNTRKSENHISTNDICSACHTPDNWKPATVDHNQVIGQCESCHQLPNGHIRVSQDCSVCHDSASWSAPRALLTLNRSLWENSQIPTYRFNYRCACLSQEDMIITVSDGIVTEAYFAASGTSIPVEDLPDVISIERLFTLISESLESGLTLSVTYNVQYGFPENIIIHAADTVTHSVVEFQVITAPPVNPHQVQLNDHRELWRQANITSYQYTYNISCFLCDPQEDIVVVVNAGEIVEAYYTPSGTPLSANEIQSNRLRTIEGFFNAIQVEIDKPVAALSITYNATTGYPEVITVDPSQELLDDQYTITISDFQETVSPPFTAEQRLLDENKALWQQAGISDYQYTYHIGCFCPYQEDIVVVVNGGQVVEAYFTPSGTPLTTDQIQTNRLRTVDELFALIQNEINKPAAELSVTYDAISGYPRVITVDPYRELVDDQYTISVADFQELTIPPENLDQTLLNENRVLWQQTGITHYQFTYRENCFLCVSQEDIVVVVNAGEIVEAHFTPSGTPLSASEIQSNRLRTIDEMFVFIQNEINRPVADLGVTYNTVSGYPQVITIDPSAELFDDQYTLSISDLQELMTPPDNPIQKSLDDNRALWQQAGIADYQFTYRRTCFCPPQEDIIIIVASGVITDAYFTPSHSPLSSQQLANIPDIDDLFGIIQNAIDNNVAVLNVTYNVNLGYPELIYIDYFAMVIDEEVHHVVLDFRTTGTPSSLSGR